MFRQILVFFLLATWTFSAPAADTDLARRARDILDAWQNDNPRPGDRRLHIVCWRSADREFAPNHRERLQRILEHIRDFYAREMERHGFGPRSIRLDYDAEGNLVIHEVVAPGRHADYGKPDGARIRDECLSVLKEAGVDPDRETIMIFTNLVDWDDKQFTFVHKSPYYAGGDHRKGTAWQLDSAELDIANLTLTEPLIQDGEYGRISLGKHNSIFIGGIAHELGHGLGLPHCVAREDETGLGTALMGAGNRTYGDELRGEGKGTFLTLAHAMRLASHPQFSGSVKGMNLPATAEFLDMAVAPQETQFTLSGRVESAVPVYAVVAYLDPAGGGDYNSRTHVAVPDAEGRFSLACTALVPGQDGDLRLVACLANGATTTWRNSYRVSHDGKADVSTMEATLTLSEFIDAVRRKNETEAASIRDGFREGSLARKVATSILESLRDDRELPAPADVPDSLTGIPLSRTKPVSAEVGWLSPTYDRLPRADLLLVSGAELHETGIYAHASARHEYDLGGKWKRLTGRCGMPQQVGGSVVFAIRVDGNEAWRSPTTKPGTTHPIELDVSGAKTLELIVEDAGDGKNSDWGLWLDPMLLR